MIKRRFDKLLAEGHGRQLIVLLVAVLCFLSVSLLIAKYVFADGKLSWQDVVAILLDPGCFQGAGPHDWFRLLIALMSIFLLSALLVSSFTNVFENISEDMRSGKRRYSLHNHILILGAGYQLRKILEALRDDPRMVVVMAPQKPKVEASYIYYSGRRDVWADLAGAKPEKASEIFIIGNDEEEGSDTKSLQALRWIKERCLLKGSEPLCHLCVKSFETTEVLQYSRKSETNGYQRINIVNDYEYLAEQLLVGTDFLPALRKESDKKAHVVIIGTGVRAQAVAYTVAHVCHYPNGHTQLTVIDPDALKWGRKLMAARPALYEHSRWAVVEENGRQENECKRLLSDIDWQFVNGSTEEPWVRALLEDDVMRDATSIIICNESDDCATTIALHLPRIVYQKASGIAVWIDNSEELLRCAAKTNMYGQIKILGTVGDITDPLYRNRITMGQRVNHLYYTAYVDRHSTDLDREWYGLSETDKYSSIYCANATPLRMRCYDTKDLEGLCESEHRRWNVSQLLMGYIPGEQTDKEQFVHADLKPYEELPPEEHKKDYLLVSNAHYILMGDINNPQ